MLQVKALPAKGFARALGDLALAISALSLGVHAFAVFGSYSNALMRIEDYLFFGLFPIMILASLAYRRLLSEFSFADRVRLYNPKFSLNVARKLYANAPRWLRVASLSLLAYAALRSILSFGFSDTVIRDAKGLAVFSAFLAAFSALAATTLISYAGTEHPLRPDELRKAHPPR
jgi:hypothetical protein